MENYNTSLKITPVYKWINILEYKVEKDAYGLKGFIKWNTRLQPRIQIVSSIHLDKNRTFIRLFRWKT